MILQLNLAGNPLEILSSKLFLSTEHLTELDLSDCDLTKLWHDSSARLRGDNLLTNLKFLNVSNNDIKNIFPSDLAVSYSHFLEQFKFVLICTNFISFNL